MSNNNMNNSGLLFKGLFLSLGLVFALWGLITDSIVKTFGGLGFIFLALIINGD